ncbi:MAG: hypothetical protein SFX73_32090 [Kofleriaceae bacterium]|nr:hypothetical protein [Kofleriaceae bacterium]
MRTQLLVLVALLGCKKASEPSTSGPARSTKDADALWALAPEKLKLGFVITPRAMDMLEGGALRLQALVQSAPDLAFVKPRLDELTRELGGSFTGLADLGLDKSRGIAWFIGEDDVPLVALPIADRAKLARLSGQDFGTDPNKLGPMTCKTINTISICSQKPEALEKLGTAKVPAPLASLGVRGDIEVVGGTGELSGAGAIEIERGEAMAHVTVDGVPPNVALPMGMQMAKPRVEPAHSVAFATTPITLFSQAVPPNLPLPGGGTAGDLFATVNGPVTITIAAGTLTPDVRIPVSDPAPAQRVIDQCKELIPPELLVETKEAGTCRFKVPQYSIELDLWTEAKEVRLGTKQAGPTGKTVTLTPLAKEIADQSWSIAFWGRGTMFGATGFPAMANMSLPDQGNAMVRALSILSEMGIAFRVEGKTAKGVFGFRTVYANPDDVVTKLLAIPPADIIAGKADAVKAIAAGAPSSQFAGDYAAGQGGLMVPTAVIGMLAAVAVPAFTKYMQRAKASAPTQIIE